MKSNANFPAFQIQSGGFAWLRITARRGYFSIQASKGVVGGTKKAVGLPARSAVEKEKKNMSIKKEQGESKHTPGPWDCHAFWPETYKICPEGTSVLEFQSKTEEERYANACLIGAAPDILRALKDALVFLPYSQFECDRNNGAPLDLNEVINAAKAAINKAEGN